MSTKDRILEEALTLFAQRGYDGTGVDLIAARVGVTGPSLYKHFKSKKAILDALIDTAEERYERFVRSGSNTEALPENREELIAKAMKMTEFSINDPIVSKIRVFLIQEQFRNERLAKVTSGHQFDGVVSLYEKIIKEMMEAGQFIEDDPAWLAVELIAPVVLMVYKIDRQPELKNDILAKIEKHIHHFCDVYMK